MGSMRIQRCPSTSTEISGLVANLTSDKCSINEIRFFLKAIERNSSFQARMTWIHTLFFRPFKQNSALRQQMQYAWNMARFLSHEAKQLISCLNLKALKQNSPFQARKTWYILCSSSHLDKTALNAEKLDAPYVKYASFIKSWSKTTHFKGGSREAYRVLRPIKRDRVLHRHVQYAWNMPFSPDRETRLVDIEFDRSKICSIIFYSRWTKLA